MKKMITLLTLLIGLVSLSKAQNNLADTVKTKLISQADSANYAMGLSIAQDLKSRGINDINFAVFVKAMQEVFIGKAAALNPEQCQQAIMTYFSEVKKQATAPLLAEAKRFLEENKKKKGIITTTSGLQYEILIPTKGVKPLATDDVTVHYKGTLTSGKQFDSSYERNEPATFKLNQVIPGWTEGVQLMTLGSKYRFYIPYQLGYGENGAGEDIPPYSVLIFEIELIKIGS